MSRKLAIFDIDGTIAVKGKIPGSVIEGLKHLQSVGYLTTVSTGRGYRRMRDALAEHFEDVISPDALIILEHGTKITHRDGSIVQADYFSSAEKDHFVDFIRANHAMVQFASYSLSDAERKVQIWVKSEADVAPTLETRREYADVFHESDEDFKERLNGLEISHFLAKLEDFVVVHNLKLKFTRSKMDLIFMDGYMQFVGSLTDKAKAIAYLEKFHETNTKDMLVAGNGINDVDMLNMDAGLRILVGSDKEAESVICHLTGREQLIRIESPETLGTYLQQL